MAGKQAGAGCRAALARAAAGAVLALVAVAPAASAQTDRGYATRPFTPPGFKLPDGEGCAGDVARWKAVQDNDYAGGNIGLKVYHQIQAEIARADAACQAGHDAEARSLVHGSKVRHGYPG